MVFDSLDAMMQAYAAEAVRAATQEYRQALDYSPGSIATLDAILEHLAPETEPDQEFQALVWGSYFGEVLRRQYQAEWTMTPYPGGSVSVPTVEVGGSRLYPTMKVHRRLTLGPSEDILTFYKLVKERLGKGLEGR
jgi:hypothetical protein